jgi:hypothetical protein
MRPLLTFCGSGNSLAGCIAGGALVGAAAGSVGGIAAAGLAAIGVAGTAAAVIAGGASGLAGGLASQTMAGHYDIGELAIDTVAGAATAGLASKLPGVGGILGRLLTRSSSDLPLDYAVTNATAPRPGTLIPRSFNLRVGGEQYYVHPNATKHMAEYALGRMASGTTANPDIPISTLAGALQNAQESGTLAAGRNFFTSGPWELGIDINPSGNTMYHAVYRP